MISSILKLDVPELKTDGKMEVMAVCRQLMPEGKPKYIEVVKYEPIRDMVKKTGASQMHKLLILIIMDFCNSVNVVRSMTEDQIIEAAGMLLDECGNFRLEDYLMMFQMAKRGELIKIYDRVDIQVISQMLDEYWKRRNAAGENLYRDEVMKLDSIGPVIRRQDGFTDEEIKMESDLNKFADSLAEFKNNFRELKERK